MVKENLQLTSKQLRERPESTRFESVEQHLEWRIDRYNRALATIAGAGEDMGIPRFNLRKVSGVQKVIRIAKLGRIKPELNETVGKLEAGKKRVSEFLADRLQKLINEIDTNYKNGNLTPEQNNAALWEARSYGVTGPKPEKVTDFKPETDAQIAPPHSKPETFDWDSIGLVGMEKRFMETHPLGENGIETDLWTELVYGEDVPLLARRNRFGVYRINIAHKLEGAGLLLRNINGVGGGRNALYIVENLAESSDEEIVDKTKSSSQAFGPIKRPEQKSHNAIKKSQIELPDGTILDKITEKNALCIEGLLVGSSEHPITEKELIEQVFAEDEYKNYTDRMKVAWLVRQIKLMSPVLASAGYELMEVKIEKEDSKPLKAYYTEKKAEVPEKSPDSTIQIADLQAVILEDPVVIDSAKETSQVNAAIEPSVPSSTNEVAAVPYEPDPRYLRTDEETGILRAVTDSLQKSQRIDYISLHGALGPTILQQRVRLSRRGYASIEAYLASELYSHFEQALKKLQRQEIIPALKEQLGEEDHKLFEDVDKVKQLLKARDQAELLKKVKSALERSTDDFYNSQSEFKRGERPILSP